MMLTSLSKADVLHDSSLHTAPGYCDFGTQQFLKVVSQRVCSEIEYLTT